MTVSSGPAAEPRQGECLYSWKEIAAYLKHGVRTVQRWEQTEGLPVHRHPHHKRDSVYAYTSELDAWWKSREAHLGRHEEDAAWPWSGEGWPGGAPAWGLVVGTILLIVLLALWVSR